MKHYGKIIGAAIGLFIAWPYGIFFGAVAGYYLFDKNPNDQKLKEITRYFKNYVKEHKDKLTLSYLLNPRQVFIGKITIGIIGLLFFGFPGLVLGVATGHIFIDCNDVAPTHIIKERLSELLNYIPHSELFDPFKHIAKSRSAKNVAFMQHMTILAAKLSKADGVVSKEEVAAFKKLFNISPKDFGKIGKTFDAAKKTSDDFEPSAKQLYILFKDDQKTLERILEYLFFIAAADEEINDKEMDFLENIAEFLNIDKGQFNNVYEIFTHTKATGKKRSKLRKKRSSDPYDTLGISPNASNAEIKKAWKKLIREHHPDALAAKGLSEKMLEQATKKMAEINAAYDRIATDRGIK
ncbi:MAG: TerB family tellurite resistance protein [Alphaproteobacteria bacterium]